MHQQKPEFKVTVARIYRDMCAFKSEHIGIHEDGVSQSIFKRIAYVVNKDVIATIKTKNFPVWELFDEALQMVAVDVRNDYGCPVVNMEVFDHQAREWFLMNMESMIDGSHPWLAKLNEDINFAAVFSFGYGSIKGEPDDAAVKNNLELTLLPVAFMQLMDYRKDKEGEEEILAVLNWDIQRDGVLVTPETLKNFGRTSD